MRGPGECNDRDWGLVFERYFAGYANSARIGGEEAMIKSDMIVHGIPGSPYVRAALLALEEKGAE